jgi:glycosyltransferase involved in cell wall biosynthesis
MRILHVCSGLDPRAGGPPAVVLGLARAQAAAGAEVGVLSTFQKDVDLSIGEALRAGGVRVEMVGPAISRLLWHPRLKRSMVEAVGRADVVHIHAVWEEAQHRAAAVARRLGVPYLMMPHGMLDPWSLLQSRTRKRLYMGWRLRRDLDHAAALCFTTDSERDLVRPLGLRPPSIVEPLGLDLREFEHLPPERRFRSRFPALAGRPIVLFLSRIHPKKGLDVLVPAFARAQTGDAMLVIAGPDQDGYRATVERMIGQHGLTDRALFTGMLRGIERVEALVDADVFALPSYQENFGIVVAEAMAAGCPVIISDQVNLHDQVTRSGAGAVVSTKVELVAAEITRFLADGASRVEAGRKGRAFALEEYDWAKVAMRWLSHYRALVTGTATPAAGQPMPIRS